MKGISPIVSVVVLIVISLSIASLVAPWMYELVLTTANETGTSAQQQVRCRSAGLDFDSDYGYYGVQSNFSLNVSANESDWIKARIVNTGNINLYGFTFEVLIENGTEEHIMHYDATDSSQQLPSDPLRPSMSAIITANITEDWNETIAVLREVRILNPVCPEVSPSIEL
jgi:flagellin-like protein